MIEIAQRHVVARTGVATRHGEVVTVRQSGALHLLLPVDIATHVVRQGEIVLLGIGSELVGRGEVEILSH